LRPIPRARPLADQGKQAFSTAIPFAAASASLIPIQAISGSV
jgi:hypothetical protein